KRSPFSAMASRTIRTARSCSSGGYRRWLGRLDVHMKLLLFPRNGASNQPGAGQSSWALGHRLAAMPLPNWVRPRFPKEVAWGGRRLDTTTPRGFWLTFTLTGGALAAWAFAGLTQDVVGHDEMALFDPRAKQWIVAVRTEWLTGAMRSVTWLGSTAVIVPALVLTAAVLVMRGRDWRSAVLLSPAVACPLRLYNLLHFPVSRPPPPSTLWIGEYSGAA